MLQVFYSYQTIYFICNHSISLYAFLAGDEGLCVGRSRAEAVAEAETGSASVTLEVDQFPRPYVGEGS